MNSSTFALPRMGVRTRWMVGAMALLASLTAATSAHATPTFTTPQTIAPTTASEDYYYGTRSASDGAGNGLIAFNHVDYAPDFSSAVQRVRYVTRNAGGSFSGQQTPSTPGRESISIDAAMNKSGTAVIAWLELNASSQWIVRASVKPAGGSFGAPQDISGSGQSADSPSVAISDNGAAILSWTRSNGTNQIAQAAIKPAGSNFFGSASDLSATGQSASGANSAIDTQGNATVIWYRYDGSTYRVQAVTKPSAGGFGSVQTLTPSGAGHAFSPRVAMSSGGRATAVWYRYSGSGFSGNAVVQSAESNASGTFGAVQDVTSSTVSSFAPSVDVNKADNTAVTAWYSYNGSNYVVYGATRNSGGFFGTQQPLSSPGASAFSPLVKFDDHGNAMAIWGASSSGDSAPIQASRRPAGGSFGGPEDVSDAGEKTFEPWVDFDSDGNGIVGYVRYSDSPTCCPHTMRGLGFDAAGPTFTAVNVPGSGTAGQGLGFSVSAKDTWSSVSQITWNFGDGGGASGGSVGHTYGSPGSYTVTVTARDGVGNTRTTTRTISIGAAPTPPSGGGGGGGGGQLTVLPSTTSINSLAFAKFTRLRNLSVKNLQAGSTVVVTCKTKKKKQQKKGCPYKRKRFTTTGARASLNLRKPFRKRKVPVGTKITITITAPGFLGKKITYTIRARKLPKSRVQCLSASGRAGSCA